MLEMFQLNFLRFQRVHFICIFTIFYTPSYRVKFLLFIFLLYMCVLREKLEKPNINIFYFLSNCKTGQP